MNTFRVQEPPQGTITKVCCHCGTYSDDLLVWDELLAAYVHDDQRECIRRLDQKYIQDGIRAIMSREDLERYYYYDE